MNFMNVQGYDDERRHPDFFVPDSVYGSQFITMRTHWHAAMATSQCTRNVKQIHTILSELAQQLLPVLEAIHTGFVNAFKLMAEQMINDSEFQKRLEIIKDIADDIQRIQAIEWPVGYDEAWKITQIVQWRANRTRPT